MVRGDDGPRVRGGATGAETRRHWCGHPTGSGHRGCRRRSSPRHTAAAAGFKRGSADGATVVDPVPFQVVAIRDGGDGPAKLRRKVPADEVHVVGAAVASSERKRRAAGYEDLNRLAPAGQLGVEFSKQHTQPRRVKFVEAFRRHSIRRLRDRR